MAEAVLFSLTTAILKSIATEIAKPGGAYASENIQLLCFAEGELRSLEGTVQSIHAVLLDAEKQQWHNNQVKLWLKRLKDVLFDLQDLLDDVATEDLRWKITPGNKTQKAVRVFFSKSNQLAYRHKVANKIQELRKKLDRIKNDRKFRLEEHTREETMAIGREKESPSAPDRAMIGREEDKEKIKGHLFDSSSSQGVSYVAIVGKGGLGKTALARLVYNDGEVKQHFELQMWVCVSDIFDVKSIIKDILNLANCPNHESERIESLYHLQCLLDKTLGGKRYLLVLDDMWNEVRLKWMDLGDWLKGGKQGSKILVTSRSHKAAKVTDEKSVIYPLEGLDGDRSWDLFREVAFGDGQASVDQKLEKMGREIVRKCAGVPLAIKTIGSLLYDKKEEEEWNRYIVTELPEIPELDALDNGILQVLKFSYDHLPSCLKHCFAYCSLFPKDYIYNKEEMIHLWMAQGFIESPNREDDLEEVAKSYLSELLCRSFLDTEIKGNDDELQAFKMHDLMHDLAQKVAGGECKSLNLERGDNDGGIANFEGRVDDRGIRHASFISKIFSEEKMASLLEPSKLRTLLFLKGESSKCLKGESSMLNCHEVFSRCIHSRALRLSSAYIPLPPSSFEKLKHLRFLEIYGNLSIKSLPDSIADLVNLQTLSLNGCKELKSFPRDLRKLVNLRHLSIENCDSLSHLPPLSELPSLRMLILESLDALEFLEQTSEAEQSNRTSPFFPSLERLSLVYCWKLKGWRERRRVTGAHQKHRSDNSPYSFPKLRSVYIWNCPLLTFVPPFPEVEELEIHGTKPLEQQLMGHPNCPSEAAVGSTFTPFSKLKRLFLVRSTDTEPSMLETLLRLASNLESMRLYNCDLRRLTQGMRHLSSLQELHIQYCAGLDLSCQEDEHGSQWRFLTRLRSLKIEYLWILKVLPEGIQHITTLQSLEIYDCPKLRSLPKWIRNFPLLEKLEISKCPGLTRLPFEMRNLPRLKELRILDCPALKENCLADDGEDWPKDELMPVIVWDN